MALFLLVTLCAQYVTHFSWCVEVNRLNYIGRAITLLM